MATSPRFVRLRARLAALRLAALRRPRPMRRPLRRLARLGLVPALAAALAGAPLGAQQATLPPVDIFNFETLDDVGTNAPPDVAVRGGGELVTVWSDVTPPPGTINGGPAATASDRGVLFRRARPDGTPVGAIGRATSDLGRDPAVAMDEAGTFVVAWEFGSDIFYHRFAQGGPAQGGVRPATAQITGEQGRPDAAMDADGDFVLTWQGESGPPQLYARRYGQDGLPRGDEVLVAAPLRSAGLSPPRIASSAVAMSDGAPGQAGAFAVAWGVDYEGGSGVYARLYGAGGLTPRRDIVIATIDTFRPYGVDVAMDAAGDFVVAWLDPVLATISAQRFDETGSALGRPIIVFDPGTNSVSVEGPAVAMDEQGDFVVTWHERFSARISSQRYTAEGVREAETFALTSITLEAGAPAVAMDADGEFTVAWLSAFGPDVDAATYRRPRVVAQQSAASTVVWESGITDTVRIRPLTPPAGTITVTLTPENGQIDLGAGRGEPRDVVFERGNEFPRDLVTVTATDDGAAEGLHTARVAISVSGPGTIYADRPLIYVDDAISDTLTVQILDDDRVSYNIATSTAGVTEGAATPVRFTVFRGGALEGPNTVGYRFGGTAAPGKDFTIAGGLPAEGALTFAPGQTRTTLEIGIVDDQVSEPNKSIELWLTGPIPNESGEVAFPVAVVTLGDNDLAEVRVTQTGGGTRVVRGGPGDELKVALRTVPAAPVRVILTPTSEQLNLGAGWGAPFTLTFQPDESAYTPRTVQVYTAAGSPQAADAGLDQTYAIKFSAAGDDPGYAEGARFTVDGEDAHEVAVVLIAPPGSGQGIRNLYLPLLRR